LFSYILQNGGGQANGPVGDQGAALLVPNIEDTRNMIQGMNLNKNIPVGNSDAGAYFNNKILAAIDYGVGVLSQCSSWVFKFLANRWRMCIPGLDMLQSIMQHSGP